ncbi:MAG: transglutaminase domain-containing protein [Methanothrix sp.]
MFYRALWLCTVLIIGSAVAADVPFVFDGNASGVAGYSQDQIEQASAASSDLNGVPFVSSLSDNETLEFPVTGGGSAPGSMTEKKVGELKATLDARVEPGESRVREEATVLALKYPGDLTIDQIASIYSYLKNGDGTKKGWGYVRDPRGIDDFGFANKTLKIGDRANCVGGGDCDDFAILMSALIESIGGTTRIILARNNTEGGHAYTEVYLGNLNAQNNQVEDIIKWLRQKFNTDKIFTHIDTDTDTKDVWLNMDWGADEKENARPGGPFFQGDKHIVICIRDRYEKTALKLSEQSQTQDKQSIIVSPMTVSLEGHSSGVYCVAFSPDGRTMVSGSGDKTIKLWETANGTEIRTLQGHSSWVNCVAFSPDENTLASGSGDKTIKIWDTASGTEIRTLQGHSDSVLSVAFSPEGSTLASGSSDNTIKIWDTASGTEIRTLQGHSDSVRSIAFSPDGLTIASASDDDTIKLWDTASGTEVRTLQGHSRGVNCVTFSPDGRTMASGSDDNTTKLWDTASGMEIRTLEEQPISVHSVAFSPDGRTMASGGYGGNTIKLWDTASGTEVRTLEGHSSWVDSVAFSPDGRTLASGSSDNMVKLWKVA